MPIAASLTIWATRLGTREVSLALLDRWEQELDATYSALASGDGYSPDRARIRSLSRWRRRFSICAIPRHEFSDLLTAFRQDQTVTRYETFDESAWLLQKFGEPRRPPRALPLRYKDEERQQLSDFTCTALQLANFWQDVSVDWKKGRVYLPLEDLRRFGVSEAQIAEGCFNATVP